MRQPISLMQSSATLAEKRARVDEMLRGLGGALIAYSGGVDSTLLLRLAHDALGDRAAGAIAVSPSLPPGELEEALEVAAEIGVAVHVVHTREFEDDRYLANNADRCYHCKIALFDELEPLAQTLGIQHILYGANHDDLGDFRPGQVAARKRNVGAPLLDAGISKVEVRDLSRQLGLRTWNKPAMACLSSRIPFGTRVDPAQLARIASAERFLRELGALEVRVRVHNKLARIELDAASIELLMRPEVRSRVISHLKGLGYQFVTLDLEGFRSGSMNATLRG
jgi:pyridinium-3,5-biscarboxylic acid mononucleotide sulfurtransferase